MQTRQKLIDSYRKGWQEINKLCNFDTVLTTESKVVRFGKYEFYIHAGMHILAVDDETLAKWVTVSRMVSEHGGISGVELIEIVTGGTDENI